MTNGTLKIHTENILPIIKKWLYSSKDIFVRELVSNACDALHKLRVLADAKEASIEEEGLRIDLILDKEARTLKVIDTGIGMSADEVEKYIAQIAFSGAEDFLDKYKSQKESDQIIGHFGLGFFSAYMVSEKVTIDTLSYRKEAEAVFWECNGSTNYLIDKGTKTARGTEITLFIDKESDEFLEETSLSKILEQYCAFLPFPIYLNDTLINDKEPLWVKAASSCTDQEYLDFYRRLYPMDADPLFWIHLNVDYPFNLKGILYFPKLTKRFEWNSNSIKLFCNRVFVSDNCKDLIPDYLMVLRGALDSPDIPLNVSRSTLQMDKTVRQLGSHISKKISDRLNALYESDREKFLETWPDIEMIVKLGLLQDEKFYERAKTFTIWKNTEGAWTTIEAYLERHAGAYNNKVFYTHDDKQTHFLNLYKEKGIEVLYASSPIDTALINFLEGKLANVEFQRIDGAIDSSILDSSKEKTALDADGKTEASKIADLIASKLPQEVTVEAKSLASEQVPAFILLNENLRRMRDYMALSGQTFPNNLMEKRTFVVNTNHKLINSLFSVEHKNPELAKDIVTHLYELSLLSQKELDPSALPEFIERANRMLAHLSTPVNE